MKLKNIISVFLVLVLVMQLLPVRQAVKYFLIDNQTVEEMVEADKDATKKFRLLDESHCYLLELTRFSNYFFIKKILCNHFAEKLPLCNAHDVQTPPPDVV